MPDVGLDAVTRLRQIEEARANAFYDAFGSAGDDPEDPSIICAVQRNRVAFLQVAPALLESFQSDAARRPSDSDDQARRRHQMALLGFNSLVNGVIHAAQEAWRVDFADRLTMSTGGR
ncbi:hypothetical protein [Gordonia malaquae]|uniref:hypothetical protein n=1 Tax=Gordonia malaquae TaxID=410332 RepID=UPI003019CC04